MPATVRTFSKPKCGFRWPLLNPNAEDRSLDRSHACWREPDHEGDHRCACGATPKDNDD